MTRMRRRRRWVDVWKSGIATERLILRALTPGDYDSWQSGYASRYPAKHRYDGGPVERQRLARERYDLLLSRHERLARRDEVYVFTAFARGSEEHIGAVDISAIRRKDNGWANVGYFVHNHHQGHDYGAQGLRAVLAFGLCDLCFHRIEAAIRPDNVPAIACAKAAGMQYEALRRSFWLDDDGWADHEIFVSIGA